MMQISDSYNQKHSLFHAMSRFMGAVNNMDQTVMVPSLLRDVPLEEEREREAGREVNTGPVTFFRSSGEDMYSYYVLLKSIRNDMEWGILQGDDRRKEKTGVTALDISNITGGGESEDEGLEKQFHYHLTGLHTVLAKLTRKANTLTTRYKQEIGIRGCGL